MSSKGFRKLSIPVMGLVVGAVVWFGVAQGNSNPKQLSSEERQRLSETLPKRPLPPSASDLVVMGVWRNCAFHVVTVTSKRSVTDFPDGTHSETQEIGSAQNPHNQEMEAQLPPVDPKCDNVAPTSEQIAGMRATVDAEQAKYSVPKDTSSKPPPPGKPGEIPPPPTPVE